MIKMAFVFKGKQLENGAEEGNHSTKNKGMELQQKMQSKYLLCRQQA